MAPAGSLDPGKLRFDTEELEDLYENAPCGYLSLKPDGRIDRVNATFLAWTGHSVGELQGRRFQDLLNIAGKIYYETHFAPLLRLQGFFNEVALDLVAKDDTRIPVLVNAVERRDAAGKALFIRITVFNATDRRRYERELLATRNALVAANQELRNLNDELGAANRQLDRANRELNAFYESLPVGIFRADETGTIVQASRRFCTLFGIEAAGDWLSTLANQDRSVAALKWQQAIRDGAPLSDCARVAAGDELARHIEMKAIPIASPSGVVSAFVGVVEDVTEQLHVETQRRQLDREATVRQLTGGFAHNLNNILAVIMGNLDLLEEELADRPQLHPIVGDGLAATQRAATLVNRLLLYSGYSFVRPDDLQIDPCLREIATTLTNRIGPRHRLTCDFRAPGGIVHLGADMLKEAIEELVANACAAMPEGGEVHLSTRIGTPESPNDRSGIVVAVRDQGTGMDQVTLAKAREPFFTRRGGGEGMGLGLSLVDGVARIAGGEMRMRGNSGKGTTVELHLPIPL